MVARQPSLFARALEPLQGTLWVLFLVWTVVVAVVWLGGFGNVQLDESVASAGLRNALSLLLRTLDAAWFALAAANVYLGLVETESLPVARRWGALMLVAAWLLGAASVWSGWSLGALRFTPRLGMRLGPVPIGWLLLWFAIIIGARSLALRLIPRASHLFVSLAASAVVIFTAGNLDPLAWRFRALWLWSAPVAGAHLLFFATWLCASFGLVFFMRETRVATASARGFPRPAIVVILLNSVFLLTHLARFAGG